MPVVISIIEGLGSTWFIVYLAEFFFFNHSVVIYAWYFKFHSFYNPVLNFYNPVLSIAHISILQKSVYTFFSII